MSPSKWLLSTSSSYLPWLVDRVWHRYSESGRLLACCDLHLPCLTTTIKTTMTGVKRLCISPNTSCSQLFTIRLPSCVYQKGSIALCYKSITHYYGNTSATHQCRNPFPLLVPSHHAEECWLDFLFVQYALNYLSISPFAIYVHKLSSSPIRASIRISFLVSKNLRYSALRAQKQPFFTKFTIASPRTKCLTLSYRIDPFQYQGKFD